MPLVSYADLTAPAKSDPSRKVYELVGQRIHDDKAPMPQPPNPRLGAADMATLDAWVAKGAPQQSGTCGAGGAAGAAGAGGSGGSTLTPLCDAPIVMKPASAWQMPTDAGDVYVCYGFDVTGDTPTDQIVAMAPRVDNAAIVHHILLLESDTPVSPTPAMCDGGIGNKKMVYGWAPGGKPLTLPPDVGYPISGTKHFMVQTHYNNATHLAGQTDTTGFDVCTTHEARPNEADIVAFGSVKFDIPPHTKRSISCDYKLPATLPTMHVIGTWPHMHKLGTSIQNTYLPGGTGAPVDLGGQAAWDFNNQYFIPQDATIAPGDVIRTRCAWNNMTDTAVGFGENTSDEMCFSFTLYWPRIKQIPGWAAPAALAKCTVQ